MSQAINLPLEKYCRTSGNFNGSRPKWLVDDALAVIVQKHTSSFDIDAEVSLKVMQGDHLLVASSRGTAATSFAHLLDNRISCHYRNCVGKLQTRFLAALTKGF